MLCKKIGYETKKHAQTVLNHCRKQKRKTRPEKIYICPRCKLWHLTSRKH